MSGSVKSSGLIRALRQLVLGAALSVIDDQPWHSITFSGVRVCLSMRLPAGDQADFVSRFKSELPGIEFDLCGQLVADIEVIEEIICEDRIQLVISALLLDG